MIGRRFPRHDLYGPKDFTKAECKRKNYIAVAVLNHGWRACKRCGAVGVDELKGPCK